MKKLFIIGNWKSNQTTRSAQQWMVTFLTVLQEQTNLAEKHVVICPPTILLSNMTFLLQTAKTPLTQLALGVQDIPAYAGGAYTGEDPAVLIKEYVDYAIIGHSERRGYFGETDEIVAKKVSVAKEFGITPIFCVQGVETKVPEGVSIVAYEPVGSIGTGNPDTPDNANSVAKTIKDNNQHVIHVLYGGSVTSANVHSFTAMANLDGLIVGGASLDAIEFAKLVGNA